MNQSLRTCLTILFWYGVSNGIILLTKWLFTSHFPYPLTVTTYSNAMATVWAALLTCTCGAKRAPLTRDLLVNYVAPIGLSTALEIGCSNLALNILTGNVGSFSNCDFVSGQTNYISCNHCDFISLKSLSGRY